MAIALLLAPSLARAESQQNGDYRGITDPFGDPANYEFAEDEREDKEFFHLGRYLTLGVDMGVALFTGGLGKTTDPGFYIGARLLYFFDRSLAFELGFHVSNHIDAVRGTSASIDIATQMMPINAGFRFHFDTKDAPRAIAVANPYLAFGGGAYIRNQTVLQQQNLSASDASTTSFGAYGGLGVEFLLYRKHIYIGGDLRYHLIFFPDGGNTFGGVVQAGDRSGNYFTSSITITYSF